MFITMMGGPVTTVIPVTDATQVGEARRAVADIAERTTLSESERARLALVATEAATNLAKHAREGLLYCRTLGSTEPEERPGDQPVGVEILAVDRGPGIANTDLALSDGYSTTGTSGQGLGAIRRQASEFDFYSLPPSSPNPGTTLMARVWAARVAPHITDRCVGTVCIPLHGETACGDSWYIHRTTEGRWMVIVADGLGHGPDAALASTRATQVFREAVREQPQILVHEMLRLTHEALRSTRGAAVGIASMLGNDLHYAGVGNIAGTVWADGRTQGLMSHDGIVGLRIRQSQQIAYAWPDGARLIMHSDGVSARWRPETYPGLAQRHPSVIAALLFRDGARVRDDATAVVVSN